ncbi:hypothetical protein M4D49_17735 [Cupriavidus pauculus]|jgi:hypothetical protein|nr:hypothetical protein [Cupriavidus pauculus]MCM3607341.1 hypothetical protein [Cupriavidus pauculus]
MLMTNVPSAAVVAVPLPEAHLACTVAFASAAPTAAVPETFVVGVVDAAGVAESEPPPPQALSAAAAIAARIILVFIDRIPPVVYSESERRISMSSRCDSLKGNLRAHRSFE